MPSSEEMWTDIRMKREALNKRYVDSTRHTLQVGYVPYMDEIADLCGCQVNLCMFIHLNYNKILLDVIVCTL